MEFPDAFDGPAMQALRDDRQRKFAWIMACGEFSATEAARMAGYSDPGGVSSAIRVQAHTMMQRPEMLDAIEEASRGVLRQLAPLAIRRAKAVLDNSDHHAHARMIETILDRTGFFAKTEHTVKVEHTADAEFMALAERFAAEHGMDKMKLIGGNVIDGTATTTTDK